MRRAKPRRAPLAATLAALLPLLPLLAACGGSATADGAAKSPGRVTLRIGDQGKDFQTLLASSHALDGADYKVVFDQFNSGPLVNQAFAAGAIDLGVMGDTPAIYAAAAGLPVDVVAASHTVGAGYTLVARAGSGIHSLADLKGRKVAYSKGTANQGFLIQALATAKLKQSDITAVDVPLQNVGQVLESGTVDAATAAPQDLVNYDADHPGGVQLINGRQVSSGYSFWLASRAALAKPAERAAAEDFIGRVIKATSWSTAHADAWIAAYYVGVDKQTPAAGTLIWQASGESRYAVLDGTVRSAQQRQADLFLANGLLPAKLDVGAEFPADVVKDFGAVVAPNQQ
ncbi:sulfonate transport system substrate-binding protein [Kitasatospora sp. MAP12-15]|uniref:ABC transporter substrate-binding protein n=1 Tax=unclassified Kitasatospora TaxID=2633591 RepID=UPI002473ACB6|nr:ABC transporter substrate-binding protein [Kitasatospora sp. MAP12-44]MDH6108724.1 sulfonate transport system substrate-binding protein [Kitasatospora sp. MAP12-44]